MGHYWVPNPTWRNITIRLWLSRSMCLLNYSTRQLFPEDFFFFSCICKSFFKCSHLSWKSLSPYCGLVFRDLHISLWFNAIKFFKIYNWPMENNCTNFNSSLPLLILLTILIPSILSMSHCYYPPGLSWPNNPLIGISQPTISITLMSY